MADRLKYYAILYDTKTESIILPFKATINLSEKADKKLQFAGGYPAVFGGTIKGGPAAGHSGLLSEVQEESGNLISLTKSGGLPRPYYISEVISPYYNERTEKWVSSTTRSCFFIITDKSADGSLVRYISEIGPGTNPLFGNPKADYAYNEMIGSAYVPLKSFKKGMGVFEIMNRLTKYFEDNPVKIPDGITLPKPTPEQTWEFQSSYSTQAIGKFLGMYAPF